MKILVHEEVVFSYVMTSLLVLPLNKSLLRRVLIELRYICYWATPLLDEGNNGKVEASIILGYDGTPLCGEIVIIDNDSSIEEKT